MCGIAGIISPNPSEISQEKLKQMADTLAHRGPDGEGYYQSNNLSGHFCGFAHRRLAIIDLSDEAGQPMRFRNRYIIIHNGEVYNYAEIRSDLNQQGYHFHTQSDTEVIVAAYSHYGQDCVNHFDGMFAFAIWDEEEKKLFCARDRFGEKPFFYFFDQQKQRFIFASEMKALWSAGVGRAVNQRLLFQFITLGFTSEIHHPEHSFFNGILQLPPGQFLLYETHSGSLKTESYWDLDKESTREISEANAIEEFRSLFSTSVQRRLRSDVPIGTSLSGGLDSSSIVAACNSLPNKSFSHHSFSCIFPGFEKDESNYIDLIAQKFKLQQHKVIPSGEDFANDFEKLVRHQEEPFGSASVYAQFKVYEAARSNGIYVLLDGQGSDETLAGYGRYIHWYLQEFIGNYQNGKARKELAALEKNNVEFSWGFRNYVAALFPALASSELERKAYRRQKHNPDIHPDFFEENYEKGAVYKPVVDKLNDILYYDTLVSGLKELLRYADRNSMASGCEVRLPFLSHELVQFVFSLPSQLKIKEGFTKWILRKAMENVLPHEIVWRTDKIGFEPPQRSWMEQPAVQNRIQEARKKLVQENILKPAILNKKIQPQTSYAAENYDWRYWLAATIL